MAVGMAMAPSIMLSSTHIHRLNSNGFFTPKLGNISYKFCTWEIPCRRQTTRFKQFVCQGTSESVVASSAISEDNKISVTESGQFSISDSQLDSRGFELHKSLEDLNLDQLNALFVKVGFPRRQKDKMERALHNTPSMLWFEEKKSGKLVAFARATGDDVFNAIIWDVVVDPSFQGFGLGKAIMERLMAHLLGKGITNIALYAEPHVLGFYRPLGFTADPDGIKAMVYSKKPERPRSTKK
eukprot:Gb_07651 [translate_table: standard]